MADKIAYTTIDEYIELFPDEVQAVLQGMRKAIRKAAPDAEERIRWQMPTFWQGENLIHFAAFKNHVSIFPGASGVEAFTDRLMEYKTSKGTIQFPLSKPIPYALIEEIVRFRVAGGRPRRRSGSEKS
ncbi:hypothetical protein AGMMS49983_12740 [Clostridia bacterium]|nr:hypothetical protein AGMMS49983_12740 [Clostridia bacterium]